MVGVVDGLEAGVAFEGGFVFGGRGDFFQARQGEWCDAWIGGGGKVAELAGVCGGYIEGHAFYCRWFCAMNQLDQSKADESMTTPKGWWP